MAAYRFAWQWFSSDCKGLVGRWECYRDDVALELYASIVPIEGDFRPFECRYPDDGEVKMVVFAGPNLTVSHEVVDGIEKVLRAHERSFIRFWHGDDKRLISFEDGSDVASKLDALVKEG